MIRAVIIDDEVNSRENIKSLLEIYCKDVIVIGEAESVASGIKCINQNKPDLVFLDIRMPDGTGFDLLQKIMSINFRIVFVTAYEQYAIKAFKFNAIDYITKPIDPDELIRAVGKAGNNQSNESINDTIKILLDTMNKVPSQANRKIVLRTLNTVHVVEIDKIMRCEANRNYTAFYLEGEEKIMISRSLKDFEDFLLEHGFFRVHNSHLINLNFIKKYMKDELICILKDNTSIPVSYRRKDELLVAISAL